MKTKSGHITGLVAALMLGGAGFAYADDSAPAASVAEGEVVSVGLEEPAFEIEIGETGATGTEQGTDTETVSVSMDSVDGEVSSVDGEGGAFDGEIVSVGGAEEIEVEVVIAAPAEAAASEGQDCDLIQTQQSGMVCR